MSRWPLIFIALAIIGYGFFEARQLVAGPDIVLRAPINGTATSSAWIPVEGTARNISFLTINDAPAYTDESGHFFEIVTPPPGVSVVTVAAVDRFGREIEKSVSINLLTYCYESQG